MFDPYGPLPSAVYWRRRVVAVAVVLLVVAAAVWGLTTLLDRSSSASRPSDRPPPAGTPSSTTPPSENPGAQARPPTPPTCPDSAVRVTAEAPKEELRAGKPVVFRFVVTNVGDRTCSRDTGALLRELVVSTPDGRRVWSSNDCHAHTTNETPLLRPGQAVHNTITWLGRTSAPGCPIEREVVEPGEYQVVAKLGKLTSEPVRFRLT